MPRVRLPRRHKRGNGKLKFYSHVVWHEHTGHWPVWPEVIHHIDGDTMNDEFSNLELKSLSEHSTRHRIGTTRSEKTKTKQRVSMIERWKAPKFSAESRESMLGSKNPMWKGDDVSDRVKYMREWRRKRRLKEKTKGDERYGVKQTPD